MSNICLGTTGKNTRCNNKVTKPHLYCYRHKNQNMISIKSTSKHYKEPKDKIEVTKDFDDVCSICLCDVDKEDDCNLICGHRHHVDCIKQVLRSECPVCKGPLTFGTKNTINVQEIKKKEIAYVKEMHTNQDATNALVLELANEYMNQHTSSSSLSNTSSVSSSNDDNSYTIAIENSLLDMEEAELKRVMEESILQQEIDEYEYEAKILKASYEENERIEKARQEKLKQLPFDEWLNTIFDNQHSIILKLK